MNENKKTAFTRNEWVNIITFGIIRAVVLILLFMVIIVWIMQIIVSFFQ